MQKHRHQCLYQTRETVEQGVIQNRILSSMDTRHMKTPTTLKEQYQGHEIIVKHKILASNYSTHLKHVVYPPFFTSSQPLHHYRAVWSFFFFFTMFSCCKLKKILLIALTKYTKQHKLIDFFIFFLLPLYLSFFDSFSPPFGQVKEKQWKW